MTFDELRTKRRAMLAAYRERVDNPPNLRDYYPNRDAYDAATREHHAQLAADLAAIEAISVQMTAAREAVHHPLPADSRTQERTR